MSALSTSPLENEKLAQYHADACRRDAIRNSLSALVETD